MRLKNAVPAVSPYKCVIELPPFFNVNGFTPLETKACWVLPDWTDGITAVFSVKQSDLLSPKVFVTKTIPVNRKDTILDLLVKLNLLDSRFVHLGAYHSLVTKRMLYIVDGLVCDLERLVSTKYYRHQQNADVVFEINETRVFDMLLCKTPLITQKGRYCTNVRAVPYPNSSEEEMCDLNKADEEVTEESPTGLELMCSH